MNIENETTEVVLDDQAKKPEESNDDELKVEVSDEKEVAKAAEPEETKAVDPETGINELKKRLEIEKLARQEAERRAHEASQKAQRANSETKDANYQLVVNAIETVKGRSDALKKSYADAMNVGDFEKAASIQEVLAVNANQLAELKRGEKKMKEQMEAAEKQEEVRPVEPPKGEIVDQLAAAVSPRSAAWLKSNRDNIKTERDARKMFRAHEDAIDDGIEPDTDDYFSFIEQRMGLRTKEPVQEESPMSQASAPAPKKAPSPPSAPVSRGGQRPNVVRLTRDQVEMAKMMGMTEAEYAKNMVALQREGKIGN
jgi:hypothetical protein